MLFHPSCPAIPSLGLQDMESGTSSSQWTSRSLELSVARVVRCAPSSFECSTCYNVILRDGRGIMWLLRHTVSYIWGSEDIN